MNFTINTDINKHEIIPYSHKGDLKEMKMMRRILILALVIVLTLLAPVSSFAVSGEGGTDSSKSTKKTKRTVHLLMVDNSEENERVVDHFATVGVKVTTVYSLKKVDPSKYDGLVIPGGGNMDPRTYKSKRSPKTFGTNIKKDKLQIKAVKRFVKAGKPVLGLCRGCQVINVAFGGKLKQHIGWHTGFRKVKNKKGYWMYKMFGKYRTTYHYHHQCPGKLGKGLVATSYDTGTKTIESIQHKTLPVYGIQWHPDCKVGRQGYKVFKEFKKICLKNIAKQEKEAKAAKEAAAKAEQEAAANTEQEAAAETKPAA